MKKALQDMPQVRMVGNGLVSLGKAEPVVQTCETRTEGRALYAFAGDDNEKACLL
ncbi:hypothetical protein [Desulfovibrio inopinatus]|uniref:hypothetical protein n=1 Tax=Desulfovibrio inopinatus TaxID=102109 RepID=UPI0004116EF0|nr:hypothetical protein [Desulfovibrio inopinatus]